MLARSGICLVFLLLSGCYTTQNAYFPDYKKDYIYASTYYGYHPFEWGEGYYEGYGYTARDWIQYGSQPVDADGYVTPRVTGRR